MPPHPRKITLASNDRLNGSLPPAAGADPTLGGATLTVRNPTTAEEASMSLPQLGWVGLGTPPGTRGYRYVDKDQTLGPCTNALLDGRHTKIRCGGDGVGFTLDEPSQGSLDVRLAVGAQAVARCFHFAGVTKDVPGTFNAHRAPAPPSCE